MFLKKLKIKLPHDQTILLLGIYPKELRDIHTPMHIAALFVRAKRCKRHKYPFMGEWTKKGVYPHNGILFHLKKKGKERKSCHLLQHE